MKKRNPVFVAIFSFITFGIYGLYWYIDTKSEMNSLGTNIPTAWLIIIPFVNIWWVWKYSQAVEQVTGGKMQGVLAFILLWLLAPVGAAIVQDSFNNNVVASASPVEGTPVTPTPSADDPAPADDSTPATNPAPPTGPTDTPPTNPVQ